MPADEAWAAARRVLWVRLDGLGDVLMSSPALRAVREARPGREVTLLTSPAGTQAAPLIPEVDDVIEYDAPWLKATAPRAGSRPEYEMAERLRRDKFDAAVISTVYSQNPLPSAFLCYLAGIPLRLAYCRENPYQLLTHWVKETEPEQHIRHEVRRQLDLVATVGCHAADERIALRVTDRARARVRGLLAGLALDPGRPWLVIHPGASAPSRRYPAEGFSAAAGSLAEEGWQVIFTGTEPERELVDGIRAGMGAPSHSLLACLDLEELAALLSVAPLLLSNNTGAVHVAAGVGTPVVDLYALTNPQHTPWAVPQRVLFHDVPCKYCYKSVCPEGHHHCLRLVTPAQVAQAVRDLVAETGRWPAASVEPEGVR